VWLARCLILARMLVGAGWPLVMGLPLAAVGSAAAAEPPTPCVAPRAGEPAPPYPAGRPSPGPAIPSTGPLAGSATAIPPSPACADPGALVTRALHDPAADAVHALTLPDVTQVIPSHEGD
jgi:hypothetical protein